MLYLNLEHPSVTKEPSQIRSEESFTPTLDINEGLILVYQYSTYDSFGQDEGWGSSFEK